MQGLSLRRINDNAATRKALADIVICVTKNLERDARACIGAEALPSMAVQLDVDEVIREAVLAVDAGNLKAS